MANDFADVLTFKGVLGHLVSITSQAEQNNTIRVAGAPAWTGASDLPVRGTFTYSAGPEQGLPLNYTAWTTGQPNVTGTTNDCVEIIANGWLDVHCSDTQIPYVVEFECPPGFSFGAAACVSLSQMSHCPAAHCHLADNNNSNIIYFGARVYELVAEAAEWSDAFDAAFGMRYGAAIGAMASITDATTHDAITAHFSGAFWLGANDFAAQGVWRWAAGSNAGKELAFAPWAVGQPDDIFGYNCVLSETSGWTDHNCSNAFPYLVEYACPGAFSLIYDGVTCLGAHSEQCLTCLMDLLQPHGTATTTSCAPTDWTGAPRSPAPTHRPTMGCRDTCFP